MIDVSNLKNMTTTQFEELFETLTMQDRQDRLDIFEGLNGTQESLPRSGYLWVHCTLIEYPDGWQVEVLPPKGKPHLVSKDLYGTKVDANNAVELGLVDWNNLCEFDPFC